MLEWYRNNTRGGSRGAVGRYLSLQTGDRVGRELRAGQTEGGDQGYRKHE